uniref:Uncharacterized protein n=1 Tax=Meloidogyne enterolobii TaxID=390850 RepID=A0A6V7U1L8_MELEN|nr:unnamed protein product [Meloidogyne enterolobii]
MEVNIEWLRKPQAPETIPTFCCWDLRIYGRQNFLSIMNTFKSSANYNSYSPHKLELSVKL